MLAEKVFPDGESLDIRRRFSVGRAALFDAWTDPEALKAWFGPEGVETQLAEVDLRVGGKYRVEMVMSSGDIVVHHGSYEEIARPKKLVFTWLLEGQGREGRVGEHVETRVTIMFDVVDEQTTDIRLRHEGLPGMKSRDAHEFGWNGCLDGLQGYVVPVAGE